MAVILQKKNLKFFVYKKWSARGSFQIIFSPNCRGLKSRLGKGEADSSTDRFGKGPPQLLSSILSSFHCLSFSCWLKVIKLRPERFLQGIFSVYILLNEVLTYVNKKTKQFYSCTVFWRRYSKIVIDTEKKFKVQYHQLQLDTRTKSC